MLRYRLFSQAALCAAVALCTIPAAQAACQGPAPLQAKIQAHPDADSYIELGTWFGDHKRYACAVQAFRSGLKYEPNSGRLYYLIGLSLYSSGKTEEAVTALQRSEHIAPDVLKPHLLLGAALQQLNRSNEAKAEWVAALNIDPNSTIALDGFSKALLAQGDYRSVIGLLQSAPADAALALDLAEAYNKIGAQDEAVNTLSEALQRNPSSLDVSRELVVLLISQNHFEDGTKIAKQALQQHPGNPEAEKLYLHVLVNDDVEHATPLAKRLLASFPHDFEVLYLNGVLEREAGEYEIARKHLEQAVSLNPNHYNSQYNLGMVLADLKDPQGARQHLEKAIALGATEPQIRFKLAAVLRALGETKLAQEQLELYQQEQQARQNRTLVATRSAAAAKELASGDPKKAVALYREAIALSPKDAMLEYKLSVALDKTGDTEGERAALEQVVQLDHDFALAHNQLGYLFSRSGDHASAEEHFRQAVRAAPAFLQAWVSLAATLGMESRFSEAQDAVATALRIDPKNEEALHLREELTAAAQARQ